MRMIFVRHGHPDYARDCLTETGKLQAAAAAERLAGEGIARIFSSPMGRARETAGYTADKLGLPVTILDYMHEIDWGDRGGAEMLLDGHPWMLSDLMIGEEDFRFDLEDWRNHPYFSGNKAVDYADRLGLLFDRELEQFGLKREGRRYLCTAECNETAALFSHGGSGACVLAHMLNLPFPYVCSVLPYDFTSVTILEMTGRKGEYVFPRLELFNDAAHIRGGRTEGPAFDK